MCEFTCGSLMSHRLFRRIGEWKPESLALPQSVLLQDLDYIDLLNPAVALGSLPHSKPQDTALYILISKQ